MNSHPDQEVSASATSFTAYNNPMRQEIQLTVPQQKVTKPRFEPRSVRHKSSSTLRYLPGHYQLSLAHSYYPEPKQVTGSL